MRGARICVVLAGILLAAGCRTGRNYVAPNEPRYAAAAPDPAPAPRDTLRVVTFNIAFAREITRAIDVLTTDSSLRDADVVLLQEMTAEATARIAAALRMGYVYYPALYNLRNARDFGNAVLSRWPIRDDAKIRLPHRAWLTGTQRIATAATIHVGTTSVRVYSAHLGTVAEIGSGARRAQLEAIFTDAHIHPRVVVGGDMNARGVGDVARQHGYAWLTETNGRTTSVGRWDHVFTRGLLAVTPGGTGIAESSRGVSDHRAVWALVRMR